MAKRANERGSHSLHPLSTKLYQMAAEVATLEQEVTLAATEAERRHGLQIEREDTIRDLRDAVRDGHTLEREPDGTVVIYGTPKPEHNCDEMGCPSIRHVLLVVKGRALRDTKGEK